MSNGNNQSDNAVHTDINGSDKTRQGHGLKEQRERRQRINRIKTGILLFVAVWMSACMILNIFLMVRVSSLQDQVSILAEKMLESTRLQAEMNQASPELDGDYQTYDQEDTDTETEDEDGEVSEDEAREANPNVRDRLETADNLRSEDDPITVYLTFDDGPSENTPEILDILKKYNVKATFFVTGKEGEQAEEWYRQIVADGHTLGMHSYSHSYSTIYESVDAFDEDFTELYDYLKEVTGVSCEFYRFPGGSSNQVSNTDMNEFIDYLGEKGMTYYDWNVVCGDATSQIYSADELAENVMKDVVNYKYSVVLMHDAAEKDTTVEALEKILQELEEMDATILPITEDSPVIHHNLAS
jgi:peptidoglycan/xylan/chitin deacetylase (PgdA/CDA1 family)